MKLIHARHISKYAISASLLLSASSIPLVWLMILPRECIVTIGLLRVLELVEPTVGEYVCVGERDVGERGVENGG